MADTNNPLNPENSQNRKLKSANGHLLTDELIKMRSNAMFGGKYKFLSRKTDNIKYGYFECLEHNVLFEQNLSTHFQGKVPEGCRSCHHEKLSNTPKIRNFDRSREKHPNALTNEFISTKIYEVHKGRLKFLKRDPVNFLYGFYECPHGNVLRNMVTYTIRGMFPMGCEICRKETRKYETILTPEIVRERSYQKFDGKVFYIERDKKDKEKGRFICREHGIKFTQKLYKHFKGQRGCVLCQKEDSRLSTLVCKELLKYFSQEDIVKEKKFDDCKNLYQLKFDFYIKSVNFLVEADGEGHFFNIPQWGGEEGLKTRISNDEIKNHYTKKNNINFLRISFFEINEIQKILEEYAKRLHKGEIIYKVHNNKLPNII